MKPINLEQKFGLFSEHWSPKIIAQMNDCQFKLVKFKGEFVWHKHPETNEAFIVINGRMAIHFREREVSVGPGEMFVIPKGTEHKTSATTECQAMLVEIAGTINTGQVIDQKTAPTDAWV